MATNTAQNRDLAPLIIEDIPEPKPNEPQIVSPPPAYYPPGPGFLRQMSFPLYDAHTSIQNQEQTELQQQYTEYFTQLFTKWIEWGLVFYKYGFPAIKWTSFFFVYGLGGWREWILMAGWFCVWCAPGLYFGIIGKQIEDVKKFGPASDRQGLEWWIYQGCFWAFWTAIVGVKFGSLAYIMRVESWYKWLAWAVWVLIFGW